MTKKEMIKVYRKIDATFKRNKKMYQDFIKKSGGKYKYFSEFVREEYSTRTAKEISTHIHNAGFKKIAPSTVCQIVKDVRLEIEATRPIKKDAKMCYMCKKRPVAEGNHALCKQCDYNAKNRKVDSSFQNANGCNY